ncbi:MAG TPA: FG-GAP-like repeat-containing protein, partial [Gammaproteobacteria bacterium]|nr:FG-GAP-like repeat-containing protein [Gammaproteobacteria bacterium]
MEYREICRMVMAAVLGATLAAGDAAAQVAGFTPGEFSVDPTGAATYRIPLKVPLGAAGMQPGLALLYHSRAGNGQLGVGWSVSGLSTINRCAALRDSEGVSDAGGVTLASTDRFCLDGQQLRHQGGSYGADGTLYLTEIQSFQEVRSYGTTSGAPTRFVVTDRAGLTRHYGQTSDSRITSVGGISGRPIGWAINRIEDKHGNFITFSYGRDSTHGEYWPTEIRWSNRNAQPLGRVLFSYTSTRPDKGYGHAYGRTKRSLLRRLAHIQVYEGSGAAVRRYVLSYQQGTINNLSYLASVQECAGTGAPCLPATTFAWHHGEQGFVTASAPKVANHASNIKWLDVDGDGRLEAVLRYSGSIRIYFANRGGAAVTSSVPAGSHLKFDDAVILDYNADGRMDLLVANTHSGHWDVYLSHGTGLSYVQSGRPHYGAHTRHPVAFDISGNGVPELFFKRLGKLYVYRGADTGGFLATPVATGWTVSDGQKLMPLEFDGDGLPELFVTFDDCTFSSGDGGGGGGGGGGTDPPMDRNSLPAPEIETLEGSAGTDSSSSSTCADSSGPLKWNPATNTLHRPWANPGHRHHRNPVPLDIDGDGLADIVSVDPYTSKLIVALNRGGHWENIWTGLNDTGWAKAVVVDWNLDGRDDLLVRGSNGQFLALHYRNNAIETSATGIGAGSAAYLSGDWNGDGMSDLYYLSSGNWYVRRQLGRNPGQLVRVRDGLDNELAVSYAALPVGLGGAHAVYRGHEASDAGTSTTRVRDFLGPLQVVESYAADAGIGGAGAARQKIVTRYQYAGAKLNLHGRGFLGFRRLLAHNVNTNIVTENVHFQEFPYTGMVAEIAQRMPDTTTVTETQWAIWEDWFAEHCSYPYEAECQGPPPPTVVTVPGPIVSRTINTVASKSLGTTGQGRVRFPYVATSSELSAKLSGGAPYRRVVMQYTYDNNGNPTHIIATTDDGAGGDRHTVSSVNSYAHSASCPSRLTQSVVTSSGPGTGGYGPLSRQRTARFSYADPGHCQLSSETSNAGTAAALTRSFSYDAFGNRTRETVTGQGISPARVATTTYDSYGRYPVRVANALGHTHSTTWHQGLGVRLSETDANGLTTSWQYDEFGRETRRTAPRSTQFTTTARAWCGAGGCRHPDAVLRVTRTGSGASSEQSQRIEEFDRLGREVAAAERNVQGHLVYTLTFYDAAGRPYANSGPFRPALDGGACWTLRRYDPLGRVRDVYAAADAVHCTSLAAPAPGSAPVGWSRARTTYSGLSTTVTDPEGRQRQSIVNVMDRLRFVREHDGTSWLQTEYRYDGHGNATWVRDPGGAVTTAVFDDAGRKTAMADPNMGAWRYAYNAAGELTSQTDAKNVAATISYDALGRIRTRAEPDGTTTWTYDNSAHGPARGKVTNIAGPHGYQERFWYNTTGGELRISARYIGDQWFWTHFDHNALGQLLRIRYPAVNCAAPCGSVPPDAGRLRVDQYYRYGHLYLVRERKPDGTTGSRYWEALEVDASGNVTREKLGNGLFTQRYVNPATGRVETLVTGTSTNSTSVQDLAMDWDRVGNLVQRVDHRANRREDLAYDGLGRLREVVRKTAAGSTIATENMQYSPAGNILSKGAYSGFQYASIRPHAVASVTTPAGARSYSYDANGNLAAVAGPGARTVSWWSYHKPRRIERDGNNHAEYWYGPGGDRPMYRQSARIDGRLELTLYGSVLYERRIVGTLVEHTHFVQANGSTVAIVSRNGTSTVNATRYLHRDHLGSIVALSDGNGGISESLAYDAWGKRRPANTWQTPAPGAFITTAWLRRGYTAHEHIDHVGLIHMGGRVYDPEIGRFLSPDPFLQFPASTQGFNRYSYVGNNPLSFTDPSGYFLKDLIKTGLTIAAGYYSGGWAAGAFKSAAAGTAVGGAVGGYLNTGSVNGAMWGAVGGITAYGIGATFGHNIGYDQSGALFGKSLLHGTSQGLISRAGGGRFGDGALGAFASSMGGPIVGKAGQGARQAMTAAAIGGTAALIGGGKFANGAISGAWVNLFNDQFGFGREAMKNPLRMLWEGFRMRFGGFESDMA